MQKIIFTFGFIFSSIFLLIMVSISLTTEIPLVMLEKRAIYRIFHVHLASAMTSYLMITISMIAGIVLLKRNSKAKKLQKNNDASGLQSKANNNIDNVDESAVTGKTKSENSDSYKNNFATKNLFISGLHVAGFELSFLFISFVLFSGMLWGKISWGVYWNWEPRLTAAGVFWFLLLALLLVRNSMVRDFKDKVSAIFTIIVCLNIPFIHFASNWFGSRLHPTTGTTGISGYAEVRLVTWLTVCAVVIFSIFLVVIRARMHQKSRIVKSYDEN